MVHAAGCRTGLNVLKGLERVERGVGHVDWVSATKGLGENVVDAAGFEASSNCTTGLNARTSRCWLQHDLARTADRTDLVWNRAADHVNLDHRLSSGLFSFSDGVGNSPRLTEANTDLPLVITDDNEYRPTGRLTALVSLENLVASYDADVVLGAFLKWATAVVASSGLSLRHSHIRIPILRLGRRLPIRQRVRGT